MPQVVVVFVPQPLFPEVAVIIEPTLHHDVLMQSQIVAYVSLHLHVII